MNHADRRAPARDMKSSPMKEKLCVWILHPCRSILPYLIELAEVLAADLVVFSKTGISEDRASLGWDVSEFDHVDIQIIGDSRDLAEAALRKYSTWLHLFTGYQNDPLMRDVIRKAIGFNIRFGIFSEAPLNMKAGRLRGVKDLYLKYLLPHKVRYVTRGSSFILNLSGCDDQHSLRDLGWREDKVIEAGYYPPPLVGSSFVARKTAPGEGSYVFSSGAVAWHRGSSLLVDALHFAREEGVWINAKIACGRAGYEGLLRKVRDLKLDDQIEILGFVSMEDLITHYEKCSIFTACGIEEPWGIRVNDAIHCGAPVFVSRGMGVSEVLKTCGGGEAFDTGDYKELGRLLMRAWTDEAHYLRLASEVARSASYIRPRDSAERSAASLKKYFQPA